MNKKLYKLMNWPAIEGIVYAEEEDPYSVLGARQTGTNILFQTFIPAAENVSVVIKGGREEKIIPMELADEAGFYAALVPGRLASVKYEYEYEKNGHKLRMKDAYAFKGYEIGGQDAKKLNAGTHHALQEILGAHPEKIDGVAGVRFALRAPNAMAVSVSGSFNAFSRTTHQMKKNPETGLFELFVPGARAGDRYVYCVKARGERESIRLDPFGRESDLSENVSVVASEEKYPFRDDAWMKARGRYKKDGAAISVYEVFAGNFRKGKEDEEDCVYRSLAKTLPKYASEMGYTHVCLLPLTEYLEDESLGYRASGFFSPTARYGKPEDLKYLIDECHKSDIGVIMDLRIATFDKEELGLASFDGTALYEYAEPARAEHPDGNRLYFDYGDPSVSDFLISSVLYWIGEYHLDGIKIDHLTEMLYTNYGKEDWNISPNIYGGYENLEAIRLVRKMNDEIAKSFKDVLTIADEITGFPYVTDASEEGLHFDLKLNNGFVSDFLGYICDDLSKRRANFGRLSESMAYQYSENFISALSHHEFIHGYPSMLGRMPESSPDAFAELRLAYTYLYAHPGKKLIFAGQEIGVPGAFDPEEPVDFSVMRLAKHKGLKTLSHELNKLYLSSEALHELDAETDGFEWINAMANDGCILSFLRKGKGKDEVLLCVFNFSAVDQTVRVGTSYPGKYKELLNTDQKEFGGKGRLNARNKAVSEIASDGRDYSVELRVAPLSGTILKYIPFTELEKEKIARRKEAVIAKTKASGYAKEAADAELEASEAKAAMQDAEKRMKEALSRAKKAHENENAELARAARLLSEDK